MFAPDSSVLASRLQGQLCFSPNVRNASLLSKAGLPSALFSQHTMLSHWALAGRMGRAWALAAAVTDIEAFILGTAGKPSRPLAVLRAFDF